MYCFLKTGVYVISTMYNNIDIMFNLYNVIFIYDIYSIMCKQIPILANIYLIAFKIMYVIFHEFVHNHLFNQAQEVIFYQ